MSTKPPPVLQALVLADQIYTLESGKRIICGTFCNILVPEFPSIYPRPTWAFVLLADVIRDAVLQLRFVNLKDNRILMQSQKIRIEAENRLTQIDLAIEIPGFPLPEAGVYGVECYVDDALIGSVRLQVERVEAIGH